MRRRYIARDIGVWSTVAGKFSADKEVAPPDTSSASRRATNKRRKFIVISQNGEVQAGRQRFRKQLPVATASGAVPLDLV